MLWKGCNMLVKIVNLKIMKWLGLHNSLSKNQKRNDKSRVEDN